MVTFQCIGCPNKITTPHDIHTVTCVRCGQQYEMKHGKSDLPIVPTQYEVKAKKLTAAQKRAEWEQTVITGGIVRASKLPRTAARLNRGRGATVRILAVPLIDSRQMVALEQLAEEGIIGQTPEEVGAWLIMEGLKRRQERQIMRFRDDK